MKILLSNLGYARGINGSLAQHARHWHRHIYCSSATQRRTLAHLDHLLEQESPDLCCLLEVDGGSFTCAGFNQMGAVGLKRYPFRHWENKYGPTSRLRTFFVTRGKSNGFLSRWPLRHETLFFTCGIKRLVYKVRLDSEHTVLFTHLSLHRPHRLTQLKELTSLVQKTPGEVILLGDFNLMGGLSELSGLLAATGMVLLNPPHAPTFKLGQRSLTLDVCLCSPALASLANLQVLDQPFSDHRALLLQIDKPGISLARQDYLASCGTAQF